MLNVKKSSRDKSNRGTVSAGNSTAPRIGLQCNKVFCPTEKWTSPGRCFLRKLFLGPSRKISWTGMPPDISGRRYRGHCTGSVPAWTRCRLWRRRGWQERSWLGKSPTAGVHFCFYELCRPCKRSPVQRIPCRWFFARSAGRCWRPSRFLECNCRAGFAPASSFQQSVHLNV